MSKTTQGYVENAVARACKATRYGKAEVARINAAEARQLLDRYLQPCGIA